MRSMWISKLHNEKVPLETKEGSVDGGTVMDDRT